MLSDLLMHLPRSKATVVLLAVVSAAAVAAPQTSSRSQSLSTQRGISDGQSGGTELQTGPLLHQPIVGAQPMATPQELPPNGSTPYPYIIAPYIQVPGASPTPHPQPRPRPMPH